MDYDPCIIETCHKNWNEFAYDIKQQANKMILLHVNIRSLLKNHAQVEYIVTSSPIIIHIIVITEVNVTESTKSLFELHNYKMYSELRTKRRGGGIIVYAHNSVTLLQNELQTKSFECLSGEVILDNGYKTYLCAVYRSPSLSKCLFVDELSRLINNYQMNTSCILVGDMNLDIKKSDAWASSYKNTLSELGFQCCITQYTRIETTVIGTSKSCLDHIFIRDVSKRDSYMYSIHSAVVRNALADHFITGLALTSSDPLPHKKIISKLDENMIKQELAKVKWSQALTKNDTNDILDFITHEFDKIYNKCTTTKSIIVDSKHKSSWISERLVQMSKKKSELLQIHLSDITNKQNELIYKVYRNRTNKYMNRARNNSAKREICSNFNNPKRMWEIINRLTGRIVKAVDEMLLKSFRIKAKQLSEKFANDFELNVKNLLSTCDEPLLDKNSYINAPTVSLKLNKINDQILYKIIGNLNEKKSPGLDKIRAKDIKYIANNITPVLTHLINQCITSNTYPDKLKIGMVRPIHKKGSYTDINNYRPITILSCIDKIIERYYGQQINNFLSRNGIIHEKQFGFQKYKSTTQLLSLFTDEVNSYLNNKKHVLAVMIDFSKAFDTLNYETLYEKMSQNGIQGPLLEWFKNYHSQRYNAVSIAGEYSDLKPTIHGCAQGSILGPTEYLLYVNDMCKIFQQGSVYQFADDTCILTAHKNIEVAQNMMQQEFDVLCKWAHDVGLSINYTKTKLMHIHSPYLKVDVTPRIVAHGHHCMHNQNTPCDCECLDMVKEHIYLGLKIDHKFHWGPQVENVCNKLRAILSKLTILKYKMPYNTLRLLYLSMADSIISYGLSSYGRTYKTYLKKIFDIQIRLLKNIVPLKVKYKHKDNYEKLFQYCKVLNVYDKFKLAIISENQDKIKLLEKKKRASGLRMLCKVKPFRVPKYNNVYGKRSWTYILPKVLNMLPESIVQKIRNKKQTKNLIKRFFTFDQYKTEDDVCTKFST